MSYNLKVDKKCSFTLKAASRICKLYLSCNMRLLTCVQHMYPYVAPELVTFYFTIIVLRSLNEYLQE